MKPLLHLLTELNLFLVLTQCQRHPFQLVFRHQANLINFALEDRNRLVTSDHVPYVSFQ